jgi:poly-gamma-glutamate capsule biosynthesis protein CapA/YwtB (metallophosphatase superfamily)
MHLALLILIPSFFSGAPGIPAEVTVSHAGAEYSFSKDTVTIVGVGDIMMGTNYPENKLPPENGAFLMKEVEPFLQDADVTFGNLEGTLLDSGGTPKTCRDPKVCYVFRTPVSYVENLTRAGFDLMSLANNHAGDFGETGRSSTMKTLDNAGILHAGQLAQKFVVLEKDSIKYGLVAFAPNSGCVSLNDLPGFDLRHRNRIISRRGGRCSVPKCTAENRTFPRRKPWRCLPIFP